MYRDPSGIDRDPNECRMIGRFLLLQTFEPRCEDEFPLLLCTDGQNTFNSRRGTLPCSACFATPIDSYGFWFWELPYITVPDLAYIFQPDKLHNNDLSRHNLARQCEPADIVKSRFYSQRWCCAARILYNLPILLQWFLVIPKHGL